MSKPCKVSVKVSVRDAVGYNPSLNDYHADVDAIKGVELDPNDVRARMNEIGYAKNHNVWTKL